MSKKKSKQSPTSDFLDGKWMSDHKVSMVIGLGIFMFILGMIIIPVAITQMSWGVDFSETGPIGDTIGGIMGPIIGFLGAFLTFLAFLVQSQANRKQWDAINQQREDMRLDRFNGHFFELVKMFRDETDGLKIIQGDYTYSGNAIFSCLLDEFKEINALLNSCITKGLIKVAPDPYLKCRFVYSCLYFGTVTTFNHPKFSQLFGMEFSHKSIEEMFTQILRRNEFYSGPMVGQVDMDDDVRMAVDEIVKPFLVTNALEDLTSSKHRYGNGHKHALSRYFRLLFRVAELLEGNDAKKLKKSDPEKRLRNLLRAQLSDEAQILLYYNCTMDYAVDWWGKKYLPNLGLLKNVTQDQIPAEYRPLKMKEPILRRFPKISGQDYLDSFGWK
jgi:hypothetical protein